MSSEDRTVMRLTFLEEALSALDKRLEALEFPNRCDVCGDDFVDRQARSQHRQMKHRDAP